MKTLKLKHFHAKKLLHVRITKLPPCIVYYQALLAQPQLATLKCQSDPSILLNRLKMCLLGAPFYSLDPLLWTQFFSKQYERLENINLRSIEDLTETRQVISNQFCVLCLTCTQQQYHTVQVFMQSSKVQRCSTVTVWVEHVRVRSSLE